MLRTANQRLATLVLVGGAVALVMLLLLAFTLPQIQPDLAMTWTTINYLFVAELTDDAFYEPQSFLEPYTNAAIVTMTAFILSHWLGLFLALRVLLRGWRKVRKLSVFFTLNQLSAALVLVGGVITSGGMVWFMSTCTWYLSFCELSLKTGLPLAWMDVHYIASSQLSDLVDPLPSYFDHAVIHRAYIMTTALAISYVFSLALAGGTLWRQANANSRRFSYNGTIT